MIISIAQPSASPADHLAANTVANTDGKVFAVGNEIVRLVHQRHVFARLRVVRQCAGRWAGFISAIAHSAGDLKRDARGG